MIRINANKNHRPVMTSRPKRQPQTCQQPQSQAQPQPQRQRRICQIIWGIAVAGFGILFLMKRNVQDELHAQAAKHGDQIFQIQAQTQTLDTIETTSIHNDKEPAVSTSPSTTSTSTKRSCLPLNDLYCSRSPEFCYQHGNDWSRCAGDHLPYYPSTSEQLWARSSNHQPMCLYEPLCWLQLDWQNTEPPILDFSLQNTGNNNNDHDLQPPPSSLRFVDWGLHDGTMASLTSILRERFHFPPHNVVNCNVKTSKSAARNYNYSFYNCQSSEGGPPKSLQRTWRDWGQSSEKFQANEDYYNWFRHDQLGQSMDVHIVSFPPNLFEMLMATNRTIILDFLHRFDMNRCSNQTSIDSIQNLIRLASSGPSGALSQGPLHIVAPGYLHDVEYVRHYTGIQPLFLPVSLIEVLPKDPSMSYQGTKSEFIWNAYGSVPKQLVDSSHVFWKPKGYQLSDFLQYKGVVHLPYSITNMKILEQYELNLPIFAPTPTFAIQSGMFNDRTATFGPYCSGSFTDAQHAPGHNSTPYEFSPNERHKPQDQVFWVAFSEIYRWPCVRYFDSWSSLLQQLDSITAEELQNMSRCMIQANKWRKYEVDSNTRWILQQLMLPANHVQKRKLDLENYRETLQALYGTETLFNA